ncbi:MAG: hypothetical protein IKU03_08315 [Bacteroidales bacterium]|nr:hypothetical protein [Bacteroidales bacterium]
MFTTSVIAPFLQSVRLNPNETCLILGEHRYTNAAFAQHISPIINELDSSPSTSLFLLMEEDVQSYAALFAAMLAGKLVIPISPNWSEKDVDKIQEMVPTELFLCKNRMQYYFRMTVEDAVCRIDNGLYQYPSGHPMVHCFQPTPDGTWRDRLFTVEDILQIHPPHPIRFYQFFKDFID